MNRMAASQSSNELDKEMAELRRYAESEIRLWKRRSCIAAMAFFLNAACIYPFLKGHPLHVFWDAFAKYLVLLEMALLAVLVGCVGFLWSAWQALREVEEDARRERDW